MSTARSSSSSLNPASLKLVKPEADRHRDDPIPLERRRFDRHALAGQVTALQTSHDPSAHLHRICSLRLRNISDSGLGAISSEPIDLDAPIAVFFPPHGPDAGFDLYGHVVRCISREDGGGHDIGIRFDTRHAA